MTNFQLLLSIGVPSLLIVVGFIYNNSRLTTIEASVNAGFNSIEASVNAGFNSIEASVNAGFNSIETSVNVGFQDVRARLNTIEGDLRQFYRDLGRHEADIVTLKEHRRT